MVGSKCVRSGLNNCNSISSMKRYHLIMTVVVLVATVSCREFADGPNGVWSSGPIENYEVTPINGGAKITYTIPRDPELLYVMAEYERNGAIFTEKSSVYKNSLTIEGYDTTGKVKASLYKVNKNG